MSLGTAIALALTAFGLLGLDSLKQPSPDRGACAPFSSRAGSAS